MRKRWGTHDSPEQLLDTVPGGRLHREHGDDSKDEEVIVLIAVTEKQVVITDSFNTQPITGRNAIFQRVNRPTETAYDIEIVGAYTNHDMAVIAGEAHAKTHPGRKYVTKVCVLDGDIPKPPEPSPCIRCQGVATPGQSFCPKCQQVHLQECAALDTMPNAPNPTVQATAGPMTVLLNATPG